MTNKLHIQEEYNKMAKNFMTPKILKHEIIDNRVIELSEGTGLKGNSIFGVAEFIYTQGKGLKTTRRGEMFFIREQAVEYYKNLKR